MPTLPFMDAWAPRTPPVTVGDLRACPVLVLYYLAVWNGYDREMDDRLAPLRNEYAGRICFRSCDTDRDETLTYIRNVANLPALGCFIRGEWFETIVGLRTAEQLRSTFDTWLAAALRPA